MDDFERQLYQELAFLDKASNDDLQALCHYLVYDKDGDVRLTEGLSQSELFHINYPNNVVALLPAMRNELSLFGGNTLANMFRGHGVSYHELLQDVCDKKDVSYNEKNSSERLEELLLNKLFFEAVERMTDEQIREQMKALNVNVSNYSREAAIAALQTAVRVGGFNSYIIALQLANAVAKFLLGRGLSIAANAALTKWLAVFAGPIGWVVTALWTLIDIAGPAYRVTIPAVIQVAYIRRAVSNGNERRLRDALPR